MALRRATPIVITEELQEKEPVKATKTNKVNVSQNKVIKSSVEEKKVNEAYVKTIKAAEDAAAKAEAEREKEVKNSWQASTQGKTAAALQEQAQPLVYKHIKTKVKMEKIHWTITKEAADKIYGYAKAIDETPGHILSGLIMRFIPDYAAKVLEKNRKENK